MARPFTNVGGGQPYFKPAVVKIFHCLFCTGTEVNFPVSRQIFFYYFHRAGIYPRDICLRAEMLAHKTGGFLPADANARFKQFKRESFSVLLGGFFIALKIDKFGIKQKSVHIKNNSGNHIFIIPVFSFSPVQLYFI